MHRRNIIALKNENGERINTREEMEGICKKFYSHLFASKIDIEPPALQMSNEKPPTVTISEIRNALSSMEDGKAPGNDGISVKALKSGGLHLWKALAERFSRYISCCEVPDAWRESKTILLFKKGDNEDLKNYRPICLLSHVYKLFTKIITNRITRELDEQQPREQAGFRKGFSTKDHIFALTQLLERSREYKLPLAVIFVDFEKAFDSVEINAVLGALKEQGIRSEYVQLLRALLRDNTTDITLFSNPIRIPVSKGVKQGDTVSPKLFSACLEMVIRRLNWSGGIKIDGERLNHLRFADDIVLVGNTIEEVQRMLKELDTEGAKIGLKINVAKTKFMATDDLKGEIKLGDGQIEKVDRYVYLGQEVRINNDICGEISRRQRAAWAKFEEISSVLKLKLKPEMRASLFNSTVLKAFTYGCESWALTTSEENRLRVTERAMERSMLGISRRRHLRNEEIRRQSKVKDVIEEYLSNKLSWAGHIARTNDNRWDARILNWYPRDRKRPQGRPPRRWEDFLRKFIGPRWRAAAQNRMEWRRIMRIVVAEYPGQQSRRIRR